MSGTHFRGYHLALDEQGGQLFAVADDIAERASSAEPRCARSATFRSIGACGTTMPIVAPRGMLAELREDNQNPTRERRSVHELCDKSNDAAAASMIENWIGETERRTWFLSEIVTAASR